MLQNDQWQQGKKKIENVENVEWFANLWLEQDITSHTCKNEKGDWASSCKTLAPFQTSFLAVTNAGFLQLWSTRHVPDLAWFPAIPSPTNTCCHTHNKFTSFLPSNKHNLPDCSTCKPYTLTHPLLLSALGFGTVCQVSIAPRPRNSSHLVEVHTVGVVTFEVKKKRTVKKLATIFRSC